MGLTFQQNDRSSRYLARRFNTTICRLSLKVNVVQVNVMIRLQLETDQKREVKPGKPATIRKSLICGGTKLLLKGCGSQGLKCTNLSATISRHYARKIIRPYSIFSNVLISNCQPHSSPSVSDFPVHAPATSFYSLNLPLSPSITPSLFHSRLKTYLFHKSFPP